jgi:polar amino acid transport system substrate-binding protein
MARWKGRDRRAVSNKVKIMNRFVRALSVWSVCAASAMGAAADDRNVHFVTDHEKQGGHLVETTRQAFQRMGYRVTVTYLPWKRALDMVMNGQAEALLGAYRTDERAEKLLYSEPVASSDVVFFALKSNAVAYSRLEELKGYRIGTILGASYTPEFDQAAFLTKEPVTDYQTNIRKLLAGRVHLIVEKQSVVLHALKTSFPDQADQVVALEKPLTSARFYNAFSRTFVGHERKVADFNAGLAAIAADGTLAAIRTRHLHE